MANRIVGNILIVDSQGVALPAFPLHVLTVAFYSTDTTGELQITRSSNTADTLLQIRNNQNQPFTLPLFLGGHIFQETLFVTKCQAGTAWFYLG